MERSVGRRLPLAWGARGTRPGLDRRRDGRPPRRSSADEIGLVEVLDHRCAAPRERGRSSLGSLRSSPAELPYRGLMAFGRTTVTSSSGGKRSWQSIAGSDSAAASWPWSALRAAGSRRWSVRGSSRHRRGAESHRPGRGPDAGLGSAPPELERVARRRRARAPRRRPAGGGVHACAGRSERARGSSTSAVRPARGECRRRRGRPASGLLRTLRRPASSPPRWPSTTTCSGRCQHRRASTGDRGSPRRGPATRTGPGRRDARRRRGRARRSAAALPRALRVVGSS